MYVILITFGGGSCSVRRKNRVGGGRGAPPPRCRRLRPPRPPPIATVAPQRFRSAARDRRSSAGRCPRLAGHPARARSRRASSSGSPFVVGARFPWWRRMPRRRMPASGCTHGPSRSLMPKWPPCDASRVFPGSPGARQRCCHTSPLGRVAAPSARAARLQFGLPRRGGRRRDLCCVTPSAMPRMMLPERGGSCRENAATTAWPAS